ncbi:type VI secretion system protein TssA [Paraburkholderia bannensis]|uniref:type VI secretion system protein TssA n=1 Tax=Paraburkholderia bannensis TaxID=765414 RepID=UPI002AC36643|nr:type VI secretion system protein TssA [Paraburkholderia bannensis]
MTFSFDIETLLQPIAGDAPCGVSLLHDPALEEIKAARREDDPSLPAGVWQTELKVADWARVEARCSELLAGRSKDLMLAAWLAQSWLHRHGWQGLPVGLRLIEALCERFWDGLHPLARDGDWGYRAAPLEWLGAQFPGLLAGRIALGDGEPGSGITLAHWQGVQHAAVALAERKDVPAARREEAKQAMLELEKTVRAMPGATLRRYKQKIDEARATLGRLDTLCTSLLGDDAPSFGALNDTLKRAEALLAEWMRMQPEQMDIPPLVETVQDEGHSPAQSSADAVAAEATRPGKPQSREAAYRQLALIGEFLLDYEPHSPVPYMIQRALEWGAMPLPELLKQLTDERRGQALGTALGLLPAEN